jgi:hypothetical protein
MPAGIRERSQEVEITSRRCGEVVSACDSEVVCSLEYAPDRYASYQESEGRRCGSWDEESSEEKRASFEGSVGAVQITTICSGSPCSLFFKPTSRASSELSSISRQCLQCHGVRSLATSPPNGQPHELSRKAGSTSVTSRQSRRRRPYP